MSLKEIIKPHIEAMKHREQNEMRLRDEAIIRYDRIFKERRELEDFIDRLDEQSESIVEKMRSLAGEPL